MMTSNYNTTIPLISTSNNNKFCNFDHFSKSYETVHGPLSFLVCVFGSVANCLNICVLTTKEMRWPTNFILTGLALADLLVMLEYIPFTFHRYMNGADTPKHISDYTYNWAVFMLFHAIFSQVFHFIACCLTVILAVWRYKAIAAQCTPNAARIWCNPNRTLLSIAGTYIVCPLICSPLFVSLKIVAYNQTCDQHGRILNKLELTNYTGHVRSQLIYYTTFTTSNSYKKLSFWIYGVVIKLVPCILLVYLSWRLVAVLCETKKRRRKLLSTTMTSASMSFVTKYTTNNTVSKHRCDERDKQADRTSSMLVAVLLLFLITEFPQAILGLLSATIGENFEKQCYIPLGDVMDILALTNSAINFILYCTMSKQFRTTFQQMFRPRIFNEWMPLTTVYSVYFDRNGEKTQVSQV